MAASDEATTSKHVEKKLFIKLNVANKNKSHWLLNLLVRISLRTFCLTLDLALYEVVGLCMPMMR